MIHHHEQQAAAKVNMMGTKIKAGLRKTNEVVIHVKSPHGQTPGGQNPRGSSHGLGGNANSQSSKPTIHASNQEASYAQQAATLLRQGGAQANIAATAQKVAVRAAKVTMEKQKVVGKVKRV